MIEAHGLSSSDQEYAIKNYVYIKKLKHYRQHLALQNCTNDKNEVPVNHILEF